MSSGLIPRDFGGVVRIEVDDAWYELRRYLGWYDRERLNKLNTTTLAMLLGRMKVGEFVVPIQDTDRLVSAFENMVDVDLQKLLSYLTGWSHQDEDGRSPLPIVEATVKRLTPKHADRLLEEIAKLEEEQDGPGEKSPLDTSSTASSDPSSSKTAAGSS